jgi:hypothetical protein
MAVGCARHTLSLASSLSLLSPPPLAPVHHADRLCSVACSLVGGVSVLPAEPEVSTASTPPSLGPLLLLLCSGPADRPRHLAAVVLVLSLLPSARRADRHLLHSTVTRRLASLVSELSPLSAGLLLREGAPTVQQTDVVTSESPYDSSVSSPGRCNLAHLLISSRSSPHWTVEAAFSALLSRTSSSALSASTSRQRGIQTFLLLSRQSRRPATCSEAAVLT